MLQMIKTTSMCVWSSLLK
uniref:Uncharacterized protein n=1 Tax=Anguilla anguilla TaxID=7936 RepID=A0A0E9TK73_ANGAN